MTEYEKVKGVKVIRKAKLVEQKLCIGNTADQDRQEESWNIKINKNVPKNTKEKK